MGFKGTFTWITSLHQGGRKAISFTLKNTNLLQPETFDAAISDASNIVPTKYFYGLKLRAGQSMTFDIDNDSWDWAQGDIFAVLDKKGKIAQQWDLKLPMMAPGECKECHGSHKCSQCNGNGKILNRQHHVYEICSKCRGTGICQTCFIPTRHNSPNSLLYNPVSSSSQLTNPKYIDSIHAQINDLEHRIYLLEQENLNLQRNGKTLSMRSVIRNNMDLISSYRTQILRLQAMIQSL